ncbi:hypothetical protein OV203_47150 [Nannocystis sp. ILAH1]|uniref:hypothetical protein n=1 Tax=Nannocystis sp. ILAH1 TaxID=2996789 RepID=UPI00227055A4|nr:hypothetical protein [Nannocystis sp. ILAH1]MCY0994795.1 hypothetical protein [Nannocystis sp. ILAH1]
MLAGVLLLPGFASVLVDRRDAVFFTPGFASVARDLATARTSGIVAAWACARRLASV